MFGVRQPVADDRPHRCTRLLSERNPESATFGLPVSSRIKVEELGLRDSCSEKIVVLVRNFSFREVPHEVSEQKCPMGKLVTLDRHGTAEPVTRLIVDHGCKAFAESTRTCKKVDYWVSIVST